jgi:L-fuconolactonase
VDSVRPFVDDALDLFGPRRLMFGGDWPISELAGGYSLVWDAVGELLRGLDPADRAALLGGTAVAFYNLDPALLATALAAGKEST